MNQDEPANPNFNPVWCVLQGLIKTTKPSHWDHMYNNPNRRDNDERHDPDDLPAGEPGYFVPTDVTWPQGGK